MSNRQREKQLPSRCSFIPAFYSKEIKNANVTSKHRKRYYYEYGKSGSGKSGKKKQREEARRRRSVENGMADGHIMERLVRS